MLQKNSESLKISQTMKNRLREILGSERHLSKFPSMKNSSFTTRYSRRKTSNVLLWLYIFVMSYGYYNDVNDW
jgi:hypothetical protein